MFLKTGRVGRSVAEAFREAVDPWLRIGDGDLDVVTGSYGGAWAAPGLGTSRVSVVLNDGSRGFGRSFDVDPTLARAPRPTGV